MRILVTDGMDAGALARQTEKLEFLIQSLIKMTRLETGLLQGNGSGLNPGGYATRAEVAAMMQRFCTQEVMNA